MEETLESLEATETAARDEGFYVTQQALKVLRQKIEKMDKKP